MKLIIEGAESSEGMKQVRNYFFIAVIALALAGCGGAQINNHLAGAAVLGQSAQATPPPQVSAEFQAEVAQISASGLRLKEALEASLESGMRHLVAVFKRDNPKEPSQAFEFRIIESDGKAAKTIFRRTEFFFSLSATGNLGKSNATDLNGDGLKEVFVQSSSGGNCWSCNPTEVYRVRNHKGELIAAGPIQKIDDLNGDGLQELLVTDTRWESYDDLSHAASPTAVMVYTWRNGQYVYAARDFAIFYQSETARLRAQVEEAKTQVTAEEFSDELYIGNSIALAITYAHMGEPERGVKELETLLKANSRSEVQSKHRATMIEDFLKGESAKKIREMKYGDAMPIG
ncbi:MAG TPA: VCBS repeat-containing protein [Blastocatellia bacterium]|nr:VCBS repeat-containing protein [Blastocatellia bacterium]